MQGERAIANGYKSPSIEVLIENISVRYTIGRCGSGYLWEPPSGQNPPVQDDDCGNNWHI